jgi:hypothetical protein
MGEADSYDPGLLANTFAQLELVGRNGMHKYNNQDHSMMTASVPQNIMGAKNDLWAITEPDYYEEKHEPKKALVVERLAACSLTLAPMPLTHRNAMN